MSGCVAGVDEEKTGKPFDRDRAHLGSVFSGDELVELADFRVIGVCDVVVVDVRAAGQREDRNRKQDKVRTKRVISARVYARARSIGNGHQTATMGLCRSAAVSKQACRSLACSSCSSVGPPAVDRRSTCRGSHLVAVAATVSSGWSFLYFRIVSFRPRLLRLSGTSLLLAGAASSDEHRYPVGLWAGSGRSS